MTLLDLMRRQAGPRATRLVVYAALGGLLASLVVAVVNVATSEGVLLGAWAYGLIFLGLVGGMYLVQRLAARALVEVFEQTSAALRDDFAERLRTAPLHAVETLRERLEGVTGELAFISTALESWVSGIQHIAFVLFTTIAVALISPRALLLWTVSLSAIVLWLWPRVRALDQTAGHLGRDSAALGGLVRQLLDGLEQAKLDGRLARGLQADIARASEAVVERQLELERSSIRGFASGLGLLLLLGSAVAAFASPELIGLDPEEGYEMVAFYELAHGPLFGVLRAVPNMLRAEAAAAGVVRVLDDLPPEPSRPPRTPHQAPRSIELRGACFHYPSDGGGFSVGPIDLVARPGELLLVTGGNGSGKTTLMKMLLGLYPLSSGRKLLDGVAVGSARRAEWRGCFTAIMSHQPLFDRLYGLEDAELERIEALLARLGIDDVISLRDGAFTDLSLSAGQRMRLAMVVALLEDRPICVFDEWTANQDPEVTHWYYDTLLPELLAAGKAVVAVSHDARFFDRADRLVHMRDGAVQPEDPLTPIDTTRRSP